MSARCFRSVHSYYHPPGIIPIGQHHRPIMLLAERPSQGWLTASYMGIKNGGIYQWYFWDSMGIYPDIWAVNHSSSDPTLSSSMSWKLNSPTNSRTKKTHGYSAVIYGSFTIYKCWVHPKVPSSAQSWIDKVLWIKNWCCYLQISFEHEINELGVYLPLFSNYISQIVSPDQPCWNHGSPF